MRKQLSRNIQNSTMTFDPECCTYNTDIYRKSHFTSIECGFTRCARSANDNTDIYMANHNWHELRVASLAVLAPPISHNGILLAERAQQVKFMTIEICNDTCQYYYCMCNTSLYSDIAQHVQLELCERSWVRFLVKHLFLSPSFSSPSSLFFSFSFLFSPPFLSFSPLLFHVLLFT